MPTAQTELDFTDGFITIKGTDRCLGYLMHFPGHGTFDADLGRVDVTKEQADLHNKLFDEANIKGLDNCEKGQGGWFYAYPVSGRTWVVKTFMGTVVSDICNMSGRTLRMSRKGRAYIGTPRKGQELIWIEKI